LAQLTLGEFEHEPAGAALEAVPKRTTALDSFAGGTMAYSRGPACSGTRREICTARRPLAARNVIEFQSNHAFDFLYLGLSGLLQSVAARPNTIPSALGSAAGKSNSGRHGTLHNV
jgi:hypothetical protein